MTISEDCANGQDFNYELSYTTDAGTLITTCVVSGRECSNGTCHHELQNNSTNNGCEPQVSQFNEDVTVSVTARNIVGRSNSSSPATISEFSECSSNFH